MEGLLAAADKCRRIAIVGASTPLVAEAFEGFGVNLLSGVVVTDSAGILQAVSAGGGTRSFRGHVRKVNRVLRHA